MISEEEFAVMKVGTIIRSSKTGIKVIYEGDGTYPDRNFRGTILDSGTSHYTEVGSLRSDWRRQFKYWEIYEVPSEEVIKF